jgi:hypothetical protein
MLTNFFITRPPSIGMNQMSERCTLFLEINVAFACRFFVYTVLHCKNATLLSITFNLNFILLKLNQVVIQ